MDDLFRTDRQTMLDEIAEHRTSMNHMKNEILQILSQLEAQKAEFKRTGKHKIIGIPFKDVFVFSNHDWAF